MIDRMQLGEVPAKPHTAFRSSSGALRYEECLTRRGFDGEFSILYHEGPPMTDSPDRSRGARPVRPAGPESRRAPAAPPPPPPRREGARRVHARPLQRRRDGLLVQTPARGGDASTGFRTATGTTCFSSMRVREPSRLRSAISPFDRTTTCSCRAASSHGSVSRHLSKGFSSSYVADCTSPANSGIPIGQLRMDAPYTHRDFVRPVFKGPRPGPKRILVKKDDAFVERFPVASPFDVVGWDGTVWPFAFDILKYQPKTGLVHLPPTIHSTFGGRNALICSFVPRVTDTHPDAIPCPYPHASVDCDEIIYYVRGSFTSRKGVGPKAVSLHPAGVPHGPHPGAYEGSIGSRSTDELAVMMDTFAPLRLTEQALALESPGYHDSWNAG